jgi:hypothetical protein
MLSSLWAPHAFCCFQALLVAAMDTSHAVADCNSAEADLVTRSPTAAAAFGRTLCLMMFYGTATIAASSRMQSPEGGGREILLRLDLGLQNVDRNQNW